ncbi:MAG: hypothetical protein ACI9Y1_001134 [Lentisphaeria bacterium]|jgi:hypothetical protein
MENRERPSLFILIFGPLIFVFSAFGALLWFFYRAFYLLKEMGEVVVVFDKGSYYALGVGVGLMAIAFAGVQETWLQKPLTKRSTSIISKLAIAGVVLTFTVPHILHYASNSYLKKSGYSICEKASHQWLFVRDIVYIRPSVECSAGLEKK